MPTLLFLCAWTLLDLLFNVRYPAPAPLGFGLLPSLDVTVLVAGYAVWARYRRPVPALVSVAVGAATVLVRLFRIGDGVCRRYFNRPLDLALDLPLSSELVRLLDSTVPRAILLLGTVIALAALAGLGALAVWALRRIEDTLSSARPRATFGAVALFTGAASFVVPADGGAGLRAGAFGASIVPVARAQVAAYLGLRERQAAARCAVATADRTVRHGARGLEKLRHTNVFLFLIESYGETVLARPELTRELVPEYAALDRALSGAGFAVASGMLSSPTYAGRSWLAQETIATGVSATDRVVDAVIQERRPVTMARIFRDAGYRTVLVQPGSTHPELSRWAYDFEQVYSAWDIAYQGRAFNWAPMPDQYVVDFAHRREVVQARQPLLIEYALISSHAPWSEQPPLVADWSRLGDGRIYRSLPATHFPITWLNLSDASQAYAHAIIYDLEVLGQYIARFVPDDSLVLILGDHQPVAEVTQFSPSRAVPVHAISRNRSVISAFITRGYVPGMLPRDSPNPRGLETLLPDLLADFSQASASAQAGTEKAATSSATCPD